MRVLIIEPHASGHHASYLYWLARACDRRNWSVTIAASRSALVHPLLVSLKSVQAAGLEFQVMEELSVPDATSGRLRLLWREFAYWRAFNWALRDAEAMAAVDAVILPYLDYCHHVFGMLGTPFRGRSWCAISMRLSIETADGRVDRPPWKWRLAGRMLIERSCKSLFVINPSVRAIPPQWLAPEAARKLRYLPDPAELPTPCSRSEARAALHVPSPMLAILVFGSIDERKGVDLLLSALSSQERLRKFVVILAGRQSDGVRMLLNAPVPLALRSEGRLFVLDRYMDDLEQARVFAASDVVWVGYRNHLHMSGVLVLAGAAGLPVVATPRGEIGRLVEENALGQVALSESPADIAEALVGLLDEDTRIEAGRRIRLFFADHTVERFADTVLSAFDIAQD